MMYRYYCTKSPRPLEEDMKYPWEVSWTTPDGDLDYTEFKTKKEAEAFKKAHENDEDKHEMLITKWRCKIDEKGNPSWEIVD